MINQSGGLTVGLICVLFSRNLLQYGNEGAISGLSKSGNALKASVVGAGAQLQGMNTRHFEHQG